ncbi:hypothetical protein JCM8547_005408 [Rhodosporidiobolus lusitaniae]
MADLVFASPDVPTVSLPPPVPASGPTFSSLPAKQAKTGSSAVAKKDKWLPRALMLGHWHKRTWDLAAQLNVDGRMECVAACTDMRDALVILQAAIPPIDLLVCSSYYPLEDVQEMLLDYEGDMLVLIAPNNLMNTQGAVAVAEWAGNQVSARNFQPKTAMLSSTGYMRRLSATSSGSGSGA